MSMLNPGKRGILTVVALMLIVGVPGIVAYSDGSDDIYYSEFETTEPAGVTVYGSSTTGFGVTSDGSDGEYSIVIDDTSANSTTAYSSISSITAYDLVLAAGEVDPTSSKIVFSTDLEVSSVYFNFMNSSHSTLGSFAMEYDEDSDCWVLYISSVDAAGLTDAAHVKFVMTFDDSEAALQEFNVSYKMYSAESIFTDDVVELIVMVGGILLLICGTFALSFIDVDTPGKAVSYAKRGIRSAGKKMRRGKK